MAEDDKYTYPGSGGVLVNTFGIRDAARFDAAMNDVATVAMFEIRREPVPAKPDADYLRQIHERMFQRIVPAIAGRIRDVDVQAGETGIAYCRPEYITENMSALFRKLDAEDYLTGLSGREFADRLADRWGELSAIHPYRDGNTRSQTVYVSTIAERAGHPIDWTRVDVDTLRTLRLSAVVGRDRPLADYLAERLLTPEHGAAVPAPLPPELRHIQELQRIGFPEAPTTAPPPQSQGPTAGPAYRPPRSLGSEPGYGR